MTSVPFTARVASRPLADGHAAAIVQRALRAPLLVKLLGANLLIVLAALAEHALFPGTSAVLGPAVALAVSFCATTLLVWIALRPIARIEDTATRVSSGDFNARVPESAIADAGVARLAATLNRLLDRVQADRSRIEYLAGRSARARDIEREAVARELRESMAQSVSAISLGLAAARGASRDSDVAHQLDQTRAVVEELTLQMRGVAESLYPGTIAEFGLPNALRTLARVAGRRAPVVVEVHAPPDAVDLTPQGAAALYRVADEALRNVTQHSNARHARVLLDTDDAGVRLEVEDDGRGVDVRAQDPLQAGLGLFTAKAMLALAGGTLQISGAPGRGTRVLAHIPRKAALTKSWQATSFR